MSTITLEKRGPIAVLTLNRPDMMNALGEPGDGDAMAAACSAINDDGDIRCAILTGAGKAFSAGGNVKAMADPDSIYNGPVMRARSQYRDNIHRLLRALYSIDVPLIAAVNGPAIGLGCDVACLADIRLAASHAKFGVTFLKLGLVPGDGGAWVLPRVVGMSRAAELFFTGNVIDAETAEKWGLISKSVSAEALMSEAMTLATAISAQPPHALRLTKALLRQGRDSDYAAALEAAANAQVVAHKTENFREGVSALLEKRSPNFVGE